MSKKDKLSMTEKERTELSVLRAFHFSLIQVMGEVISREEKPSHEEISSTAMYVLSDISAFFDEFYLEDSALSFLINVRKSEQLTIKDLLEMAYSCKKTRE